MDSRRSLCIMADDFGMHPAVNDGILEAFTDGILTDTNCMAPCPAFREAAQLSKIHSIPVGLHSTFTCDWNLYRWKPLTAVPSFTTPDGYFKSTVAESWSGGDIQEAIEELDAQYASVIAEGLSPTHVGQHMGVDSAGKHLRVMGALALEKGLPLKDVGSDTDFPAYRWKSVIKSSSKYLQFEKRKAWLKEQLCQLSPGYHMWVTHPAIDHPSLDEICSPGAISDWARVFRAIDLQLLLDVEIRELIETLGIALTPIDKCPTSQLLQ